jgi:hypothetical protein
MQEPGDASQVFQALAEAMIPSGGPFEEGAVAMRVADDVEGFVAGFGSAGPRMLRLGLRLFDLCPFFLPPIRMRRFSRLPLDQRIWILEAWEESRLMVRRQASHVLKLLVMGYFYGRPDVQARLGYALATRIAAGIAGSLGQTARFDAEAQQSAAAVAAAT